MNYIRFFKTTNEFFERLSFLSVLFMLYSLNEFEQVTSHLLSCRYFSRDFLVSRRQNHLDV